MDAYDVEAFLENYVGPVVKFFAITCGVLFLLSIPTLFVLALVAG